MIVPGFIKKSWFRRLCISMKDKSRFFPFRKKGIVVVGAVCVKNGTHTPMVAGTCREVGIVGAIAGNLGTLQATASLNLLLGLGKDLSIQTLCFDFMNMDIQKFRWKKNGHCSLCSQPPSFNILEKFYNGEKKNFELNKLNDRDFQMIDIREFNERSHQGIVGRYKVTHLPYSRVEDWKKGLSRNQNYLFFCSSGARSTSLVTDLRRQNYKNCYSLSGGLKALV